MYIIYSVYLYTYILIVHGLDFYTKTIEISHRYVILNKTILELEVAQYLQYNIRSGISIKPNDRSPFNWFDCTKE